ncbi:ABC transporter permease [Sporosarcina cyprini]|uniref:ABC transporter permease n=1 Tax=Sporosarcina cyprini TaxID=2910523 RepID=UPI001EE0EB8F|nr:ABC transporter permease [Sporosarcina cyprini]MCG3087705.1 ABC transporter permease subunit [Sporosarcina cyprini]
MKHFLFECKKIIKKRSIWIALILSVVAMSGYYFFNYSVAERMHMNRMFDLENSQIEFPEKIAEDRHALEEANKAGDSAKALDLQLSIDIYEKMLADKKFDLDHIEAGNWAAITQKQYEQLDRDVAISKSQNYPVHSMMDQMVSMFTVRATAEELRLLAETGDEPLIQMNSITPFHPTLYDRFTGKTLELWEDTTKRYGMPGFYFLYQIIPAFVIPFIILIGCFVFGNNVSSEATKKRKGLNLYAVLPVNRPGLFFAKFGSGLLCTLLFVFLILCVPLLSSLLTSGVGSLQFPVLIYDGPGESLLGLKSANILNEWTDEFHFTTLGNYLGMVLLMTAALVFLMYSVYFLLSLFFKNPSVNAALLLIVTFFGMTVLPKSPFNPFTYVDLHRVINGEFAVSHFNDAIDITNGLLLVGALGLVLTIFSYVRFRRYIVE